jgi:dolichol-phosphate mannosyltransferase
MTSNYWPNNFLTYRDRRRRGFKFFIGLISFYFVCSIGIVANVGVANFVSIRTTGGGWPESPAPLSGR